MEFIDYFGKDASCLKNNKLLLFDMDGTIYEEDRLFDGTLALLTNIEKIDGRYVFIKNKFIQPKEEIRSKTGIKCLSSMDAMKS